MGKYYLENKERGVVGNCVLWWQKNNRGYVCDIRDAKKFTEQEADEILSTSSAKFKKHDVNYINKVAECHVKECDLINK